MGWITDRLAEMAAEKQQVLPQPSIPQAEPDTSRDALIEQARASTETMRPASLQELGITRGQDFAVARSRRHVPATEITPDDTLTPQQRGMLAKLGTQASASTARPTSVPRRPGTTRPWLPSRARPGRSPRTPCPGGLTPQRSLATPRAVSDDLLRAARQVSQQTLEWQRLTRCRCP